MNLPCNCYYFMVSYDVSNLHTSVPLLLLLLKHQRGGNAEKGLKREGLTPKKFNKTSTLSTTRR